ncbi:hypothetical protein NQU96_13200 [Pseudoalteromonas elyakovii]|nr:hypothetical protein [Pseudoalteromonas elyakovii]
MKYIITAITLISMAALTFYALNTSQCISFDLLLVEVAFGSCEVKAENTSLVSYLILAGWLICNFLYGKFYISGTSPRVLTPMLFIVGLPGTFFVFLLVQFIKDNKKPA